MQKNLFSLNIYLIHLVGAHIPSQATCPLVGAPCPLPGYLPPSPKNLNRLRQFNLVWNIACFRVSHISSNQIKKSGNKGLQISRLKPLLKSTYNFLFNEHNFMLADVKMTTLKAPKSSNWIWVNLVKIKIISCFLYFLYSLCFYVFCISCISCISCVSCVSCALYISCVSWDTYISCES